jgi:hypothetical protein
MDTGFFAYLRAFGSTWGTALSGIACVPFSIAALYVNGSMQRLGYGLTAAACFVYSSFDLWRTERRRFLREATSRSAKDEWRRLEDQFNKFILRPNSAFRDIQAMWARPKNEKEPLKWFIVGGTDELERDRFRVLMEEAGNLLPTSEHAKGLYAHHLVSTDPVDRWLNTLCSLRDEDMDSTGWGTENGIESESGNISELARKCHVMCAQLAAKEVWKLPQEHA